MGSPTKFFGTVRQKVLTENRDIPPPPPLILIFFRDQKFSEAQIRKVSLRNFSALWDKMFDTKPWQNSLKPKIFRNPKLMTHWWVPLRSFSALSDKNVWQKIVTFPPPPSYPYLFSRPEIFRSTDQKGFSTKFFGTVRQNFDTKSWHNSLKPKIFRNPKLMTHWWVPLRSFSALSDKKFWQKIVIFPPPLILIFFRDQKFSEAQIRKVSLRNFSALWDKMFDTKPWQNSLKPKIFRNPKLMTHWWVPLRSFSALSDKNFWQKIVIFPPLLFWSFFETRIFQKHRSERFLYEIFRHCETKFSTQNRDITLWSLKSFDTRS